MTIDLKIDEKSLKEKMERTRQFKNSKALAQFIVDNMNKKARWYHRKYKWHEKINSRPKHVIIPDILTIWAWDKKLEIDVEILEVGFTFWLRKILEASKWKDEDISIRIG